jgi:hypothetical protein
LPTDARGESLNQNSVDKAPHLGLPAGMDQPDQKLMTPVSFVVDMVLCIVFGIYMYSVLSTHVPSQDPKMILIWGLYTTSCMVALFWLALQMFKVTLRGHLAALRAKK